MQEDFFRFSQAMNVLGTMIQTINQLKLQVNLLSQQLKKESVDQILDKL